jgi:hypothetical protein
VDYREFDSGVNVIFLDLKKMENSSSKNKK